MNLSIVSGTYNRLPLLKRMVESVRDSVGTLTYEIILVDGGSDDGTIPWCREQDDVVLIEQGELLGAVPAFNAGCERARGKYVAILNDDIEVNGDTLHRAYQYMENNPGTGEVAFKNVNASGEYSANRRPYLGYQGYLYGQCCLVDRELGDYAGWWGEGYHTYGGDTRLSMRLWELGFPTVPVEGCSITDHIADDELRQMRREGDNPDSKLFRDRWRDRLPPRQEWVRAPEHRIIRKARRGTLRTLRFRTAMYGETDELRMSQLRSLRQLGPAKHVNQTEIIKNLGQEGLQDRAREIVRNYHPDLVILQCQGSGYLRAVTIQRMVRENPNAVFVNFNGDLKNWRREHFQIARVVDVQCLVSPDLFPTFIKQGVSDLAWWLNACEDAFLGVERKQPRNDVVFLGNHTANWPGTKVRAEAIERLIQSDIDLELHGIGWSELDPTVNRTPDDAKYNANIYARSKMALSISAVDDLWGYTSDRLFFAAGSGCPTLVKKFAGMEALGFVDGDTCIVWDNVDELLDKVDYYLQHDEEREAIGERGRKLVRERHSFDARTDSLLSFIGMKGVTDG